MPTANANANADGCVWQVRTLVTDVEVGPAHKSRGNALRWLYRERYHASFDDAARMLCVEERERARFWNVWREERPFREWWRRKFRIEAVETQFALPL